MPDNTHLRPSAFICGSGNPGTATTWGQARGPAPTGPFICGSGNPGTVTPDLGWDDLPARTLLLPPEALDLAATLGSGQTFRWRPLADGSWVGVVAGRVWRLAPVAAGLRYQVFPDSPGLGKVQEGQSPSWRGLGCPQNHQKLPDSDDSDGWLRRYLRLDVDLAALRRDFARRDPRLAEAVAAFPGLRVLAQPAVETLFSYVCSAANGVRRISGSIERLSALVGQPIARVDGVTYHAFPTVAALAATPDATYRAVSLGWRGGPITAIAGRGEDQLSAWLDRLATRTREEAQRELTALPGVGAKVADCVCLFALGMDDVAPIDRHVWAVGRLLFGAELPARSLTARSYARLADLFRDRFGPHAGWAQQYLFHWWRTAGRRAS